MILTDLFKRALRRRLVGRGNRDRRDFRRFAGSGRQGYDVCAILKEMSDYVSGRKSLSDLQYGHR